MRKISKNGIMRESIRNSKTSRKEFIMKICSEKRKTIDESD